MIRHQDKRERALAILRSAVVSTAVEFVNERENPAPDLTMRIMRYNDLKQAVDDYEIARVKLGVKR